MTNHRIKYPWDELSSFERENLGPHTLEQYRLHYLKLKMAIISVASVCSVAPGKLDATLESIENEIQKQQTRHHG